MNTPSPITTCIAPPRPSRGPCLSGIGALARRQSGFTLLLTLMALIILAAVIVQFQSDSFLHLRASDHRSERMQARYAAESGIVIGSQLIEQIARAARRKLQEAPAADQDSLGLEITDDPNDPNEPLLPDEPPPPPYIIDQRTRQIGLASVTIEVHDENAKWPLLWLIRSPLGSSASRAISLAEKSFLSLGALLDADKDAVKDLVDTAQRIGKTLKLPPADTTVQLPGKRGKTSRSRRSRHRGYRRRLAERADQHKTMGQFAPQWYAQLKDNPHTDAIGQPLLGRSDNLLDHLGSWGNNRININTASPEVLHSAFQELGLTLEHARAIVEHRNSTPFQRVRDVSQAADLDRTLTSALNKLCLVQSDVFSLHVVAQLGRTRYHLVAGLYKNHQGRIERLAVFPGE